MGPPDGPSDDELVHRVRLGDADAFTPLVERYYPRLLRFGMRMLGNRADAEEAVQDALVRAFRAMDRYESRERLDGWLFQILVNRCRTLGARTRRREQRFLSLEDFDGAGEIEAGAPAHELPRGADVQAALMRLAPDHREAVLLKYQEDWSYEEMAVRTGAGVSALKMRVKRAREQLRAMLREESDA